MKLILSLFVGSAFVAFGQSEQDDYLLEMHAYEKGSTQYLFGDKVILREASSTQSKALDTLSIGTPVKILEKTGVYTEMRGMQWLWYKVKAGKRNGYILGSLISFPSEALESGRYVVSMRHTDEQAFVLYRYINKEGALFSGESELNTWKFEIVTSNNRGVEGLDNILYKEKIAEACGVDGGGIYIFNTGSSLVEALRVARVVDGGSFWFDEELIFPTDEKGMQEAIIYKRESGEAMDDEMNWTEIQTTLFNLHWGDGKLYPEIPPSRICE